MLRESPERRLDGLFEKPPLLTVACSHSHIRRLADECSVPMPIIDVAHQHLITARANGGDQLDWSSMVAGQRMSAGLPPFTKKVSPRGAPFSTRC